MRVFSYGGARLRFYRFALGLLKVIGKRGFTSCWS